MSEYNINKLPDFMDICNNDMSSEIKQQMKAKIEVDKMIIDSIQKGFNYLYTLYSHDVENFTGEARFVQTINRSKHISCDTLEINLHECRTKLDELGIQWQYKNPETVAIEVYQILVERKCGPLG